ncbi:MAG: SpoIIE family protein phosphatase [Prevotella sp.]|nr:SpoIIE family protein phosphatase [Prevotella sp.]
MLSDIYVASINTIPVIEDNLGRPDRMYDIMERIVSVNPAIHSCGISFIENYYPSKGRLFCPYAVKRDSTGVKRFNFADAAHNYLQAPWFTEALESKEGFWSAPFIDEQDKKTPLVSYLVPIRNSEGRTVAVFGADLSLHTLKAEVGNIVNADTVYMETADADISFRNNYIPYFFVVDSTGTYIMHPQMNRVVRENYFSYASQSKDSTAIFLGKNITERKRGSFTEDDKGNPLLVEGIKEWAFCWPVKYTSWTVCLLIPSLIIDIIGYVLGGVLLFFIGVGLVVVFFAGRRSIKHSVKPLKQLAVSAGEVAKGNFETPLPVMKSRDEIHMLRDSFDKMQQSLAVYVDELKIATVQKVSIESELKIAHDIQMSMLPKIFPPYPERSDIDIYGMLAPARAVGGDLFDFYMRDEKLFFCIGDVSGKGVPASLFMAVTRSLFRNVSNHRTEPKLIVEELNKSMSEGNDQSMFVTLFVGVLDVKTGLLSYCNAGHNAPLLIGQGEGFMDCLPNLPIGITADFTFEPQSVTLEPKTTIFLYTDGLNEAENVSHAQFGDERVLKVAAQQFADGLYQPKPLIEQMSKSVNDFVGQAEQSDDLTMLAIQYLGGDNPS